MIDRLYVFKSDIKDEEPFINSVNLHNCMLVNMPSNDLYYILEGSPEDVESFRQDWNKQNRIING